MTDNEIVNLEDVVVEHLIVVTKNTMVPEDGGYFAYIGEADPDRTRGYGYTPWDAVKNLAELMEEQDRPLLSPCPFCGTKAGEDVFYSPPEDCVICQVCNTFGPIGFSEVDAIQKWNKARFGGSVEFS